MLCLNSLLCQIVLRLSIDVLLFQCVPGTGGWYGFQVAAYGPAYWHCHHFQSKCAHLLWASYDDFHALIGCCMCVSSWFHLSKLEIPYQLLWAPPRPRCKPSASIFLFASFIWKPFSWIIDTSERKSIFHHYLSKLVNFYEIIK